MAAPEFAVQPQELLAELKRTNALLERLATDRRSWKLALRQGLLNGIGGVVGATLLVTLLLWVLQPFRQLQVLKPSLDRIAQELERRPLK